jgi:hypothetical protein
MLMLLLLGMLLVTILCGMWSQATIPCAHLMPITLLLLPPLTYVVVGAGIPMPCTSLCMLVSNMLNMVRCLVVA